MRSALPLTDSRRGPAAVSKANSPFRRCSSSRADHRNRPLGFHPKHGLAKAGGRRRAEQPSPLERGLGVRQAREKLFDDFAKHRPRGVDRVRRDRLMPFVLPASEEGLEHLVHELPLRARIHHLFVVGLFLETDDVLCEELEGTAEIGLECADRPRLLRKRSGLAVKCIRVTRRPGSSHREPLPSARIRRFVVFVVERRS